MIRNIQRTWFEVWGDEVAQNRILKGLLLAMVCLCVVETGAIVILGLRKPVVIAVSPTATSALLAVPPGAELLEGEVRRVLSLYARAHHEWEFTTIESQMKLAGKIVHPDFEKTFAKANSDQIRIAREKRVSQKFYINDTVIDLTARTARLSGDRILIVEGLRATNPMSIEVGFELGKRTPSNPEGVYVTSERLLQGIQNSK